MKIFVCTDKNGGMLFNNRRQSRDRVVIDDIMKQIDSQKLYIHSYSKPLFPDCENIVISDVPMDEAQDTDYCFVENLALAPYQDKISEVIIYNWNREYPSDFSLDIILEPGEWKLEEESEFRGSSHEKITRKVYKKQ